MHPFGLAHTKTKNPLTAILLLLKWLESVPEPGSQTKCLALRQDLTEKETEDIAAWTARAVCISR